MSEQLTLRALTINEVLDKALRIYRTKFIMFLGIVAIALIPSGALEFLIAYFWGTDQNTGNLLKNLFSSFARLALIVAVSQVYLGREFSIGSAYSDGLKRIWSVWGAGLLFGLAIVLPLFAIAICLAMVHQRMGLVALIFFLPFIVFLSTRWSLVSSAIVLENVGAVAGLRRSWTLTQDYFWRVLGTSFAASLLTILLTVLPNLFVAYLLGLMGFSFQVIGLAGLMVEQISLIFVMPFTVGVQVLIYYDLRIRKEGFDLLLRANEGLTTQLAS
jgi:hypothetical protein